MAACLEARESLCFTFSGLLGISQADGLRQTDIDIANYAFYYGDVGNEMGKSDPVFMQKVAYLSPSALSETHS